MRSPCAKLAKTTIGAGRRFRPLVLCLRLQAGLPRAGLGA
jgi:hypothetical protein